MPRRFSAEELAASAALGELKTEASFEGDIDAVKAWLAADPSRDVDRQHPGVRRPLDVVLSPAAQGGPPPPVARLARPRASKTGTHTPTT